MPIEESIIQYAAPTLAGIKTGSLFTCLYESRNAVRCELKDLNRRLFPKGLCVVPLRYSEKRVLIYIFRPGFLAQDLENRDAREILDSCGYGGLRCNACISRLARRFSDGEVFPHEVGLFLSYPPEDVRGFIENKAENFKCIGCWKVYGDETSARKTFDKYKKCTQDYCRIRKTGVSLERLAVAV